MNDSTVKNLAITQKVQKPGGCVGIFFQLIDWKKRLAKKKLFSKKLLTPARAKKFKGDEKMPNSKLHLIANENSGGFPNAKKSVEVDQKSEMRVPSLVARLMGLEAIPAAQRDKGKGKKSLCSDSCDDDGIEKECLDNHGEFDRQVMDLEMGVVKQDSRPQKLQKTGVSERRTVTRFGAETLHIRSVLSRAKKYNHNHNHHMKLASPLKSPRIPTGKSTSRSSRLIGAAAKILEPGMQNRSRSKGSITYPTSMYPASKTGIGTDGAGNKPAAMQNQSCYVASTSCKNCGNLLDVIDCKLEQSAVSPPIVSDVIAATSTESSQKKGKSFTHSHVQERDIVLLRSRDKFSSHVIEEEGKTNAQQLWSEATTGRMAMAHEGPDKWNSPFKPLRTQEDDASSFAFKHKTLTQEQKSSSESYSSGSTMSNVQVKRISPSASTTSGTAKDFVALNRSLSGRTRTRSPTKVDSSKFDLEKKPCNRQHSSLSHVRTLERKRRTPNVTQLEGAAANSIGLKPRNLRYDPLSGKRMIINSSTLNNSNVRNKRDGHGETVKVSDKRINDDVISFTINSPLKQKIGIPAEEEETSSENERKTYFQRPSPLKVDDLGAFLEQKLKVLQENEELISTNIKGSSSTMILQELISALGLQHSVCQDGHMRSENVVFHDGAKKERLLGTSCNANHLSPGSVLEASFSSSSLDESSVHGFHPYSMNFSHDQLEQLEHDDELLDSATSFNKGKIAKILADIVNQIPKALQCVYSFRTPFTRSNLNNMNDIFLNAELVLGIATDHNENEVPQLLIYRFLLDELDTMADDAIWTDFSGFIDCKDSKKRKELKGFVFDSVMEYFESNCCQYFYSGFKVWKKLPLCIKDEMLGQEVKREMKKWACMAGMLPDEIIEWEMSHSLGKWTDFDVEAFEASADIDGDILQILVEEVVEDLLGGCKNNSISF